MSRPWKSRPLASHNQLLGSWSHQGSLPYHHIRFIQPAVQVEHFWILVLRFKTFKQPEKSAQTMSLQCMPGVLTHQIHIIIVAWRKMKIRNEKRSTHTKSHWIHQVIKGLSCLVPLFCPREERAKHTPPTSLTIKVGTSPRRYRGNAKW